MDFGKKLRQLREAHSLSQVDFAEKLNTTQSNISEYEHGTRQPSLDFILRICDRFNKDITYFVPVNREQKVVFENGSSNHGAAIVNTENYSSIPKDLVDNLSMALISIINFYRQPQNKN
jgi:transcriptional regulator with XRE-family HTH domain